MRKHPLAKCEECPLDEDGKFVPSLIPLKSRLAVVGEAPGVQEAAFRVPFKGPSGKLLDEVLMHHGYHRSEVMYTNACLCRPPSNATPPKAAVNACRERLSAELIASGVTDVVALGGTAASVLVDDSRSITGLRVGPPKRPSRSLGASSIERVVATWHPAYCLRNADAFPAFVADIGKLKGPEVSTWEPPKWKYFEDVESATAALEALIELAPEKCVIDIEVGIDKDVSFDHPNNYDLLCIGIAYAADRVAVIGETALREPSVIALIKKLLLLVKVGAQNGKFDLGGLYRHIGPIPLSFDSMLSSYAEDERPGGHSLEVLSIEKLGSPSWKGEIKKHIPKGGNYADVPRLVLYQYNAWDAANTFRLIDYFLPRLEVYPKTWPYADNPWLNHHLPKSLRDLHDFLCTASGQLMFPELNGIAIDREYSSQLVHSFLGRITPLEETINEVVKESTKGERPFLNPRSPKQIKEYLATQGVNVDKTDADTLKVVQRRLRPGTAVQTFVSTLLEHRRQQKLYSTYVVGIRRRMYRGRVYTTYLLHGSTSGRLASRNPNLQNIVRDVPIRRQFAVSKPENLFVSADYSQAEARVIATLAQDESLRRLLSDQERDMFNELCDQIYGPGNWTKPVERVRIKALFYGAAYGRTPYSVAQEFNMSLHEATRTYNDLMDQFPHVVRWQSEIKRKINSGEDLVTTFGRRRRFWLITDQNRKDVENEALSFEPQSTASDICLSAFTRLRPMLRGIGFIRLTIHDALVAEGPASRSDEIASMLRSVMEEEGRKWTTYVPWPIDVSFGKSWGDLS